LRTPRHSRFGSAHPTYVVLLHVVLTYTYIQALGFGVPNLIAPSQARALNWEAGVTADDTIVRFMGHGITSAGMAVGAMNNLSAGDKKTACKGLAVLHGTVAAMVGHATHAKELKQPVGIANVVLHSALAVAFVARGCKGEEDAKVA